MWAGNSSLSSLSSLTSNTPSDSNAGGRDDALRSLYARANKKTQTMRQRGFICMGPNHKVKLGGNASNQIGTEQCWAKSEIGKNRKGGNRTMLVTTRCMTWVSVTMYA